MVKKTGTTVAVNTATSNEVDVPEYLKDKSSTGLEALGQGDFKVPRIKLLQPLNPEVKSYPGVAIPGEFWHTVTNNGGVGEAVSRKKVAWLNQKVAEWKAKNGLD